MYANCVFITIFPWMKLNAEYIEKKIKKHYLVI